MKRPLIAAIVVGLFAFGGYAAYRYQKGMARVAEMQRDLLPEFTEVPAGPRSPHQRIFDRLVVGSTKLPALTGFVDELGLTCADTSIRALMGQVRETKKKELEEAEARGEDIDGISGASLINYRSKKERNPQIRLACNDVEHTQLKDRPQRMPAEGRVLFVLDSPAHPLRHASYRRSHKNHPAALDDLMESLAFYVAQYGQPHTTSALPQESADGIVKFERYENHRFEWRWADLHVKVSGMSFGKRGVDVLEVVEVPWPVRADAPSQPARNVDRSSAQAVETKDENGASAGG